MTTTQNINPAEIDTQLASLYEEQLTIRYNIHHAEEAVIRAAGGFMVDHQGNPSPFRGVRWNITLNEALDATEEDLLPLIQTGKVHYAAHTRSVAKLDELRAELTESLAKAAPLNACYNEHRWSRFFLVKNNNGHIHSSLDCSTCFPSTEFGWLPNLSGKTEADAVEEHGSLLCTICYPTAPSEWTAGVSKAKASAKAERDAAKAERAAKKLAKALLPDGSDLIVPNDSKYPDRISTLAAAKMWLTDSAMWAKIYADRGEAGNHPSYPAGATEAVSEAVAAKTGEAVEKVLADAAKRAAKRG